MERSGYIDQPETLTSNYQLQDAHSIEKTMFKTMTSVFIEKVLANNQSIQVYLCK